MASAGKRDRSPNFEWILVGVLVLVLFAVARALPLDRWTEDMKSRLAGLGWLGLVIFALIYVAATVLVVPGSAMTMAAGALFGLGWGTAVVSVASTTAAALAFLIARYVARGAIEAKAAADPRFGAIDRAIAQGGWKIIALLRLVPLFPFSLGNYFFGLTAIRFWPYVFASWVAMLPVTFVYVYLGYVAAQGLSAASGEESSIGAGRLTLWVVGGAALLTATFYITRLARRALAEQAGIESADGPEEVETHG